MSQPVITSTTISDEEHGFVVRGVWSAPNLDRTESTGYAVGSRRLAERLSRAMLDGKVFINPTVRTDVNGKTYVAATGTVLGRTANADLRRMGY